MAEPEPSNCKRCGKAILVGLVEDIYPMKLDLREIPYADAKLLRSYDVPVAQVKLRAIGGQVKVTMSKMFQDSDDDDPDGWLALLMHRCDLWKMSAA